MEHFSSKCSSNLTLFECGKWLDQLKNYLTQSEFNCMSCFQCTGRCFSPRQFAVWEHFLLFQPTFITLSDTLVLL